MFHHAIVKTPCDNFSNGITAAGLGKPDLNLTLQQHHAYTAAIQMCGLNVVTLDADNNFPDSCFVEDTAVIISEAAIITNPGALSRRREVDVMKTVLNKYKPLEFIHSPGTLEGGDVMQAGKHFYIGVTARTNKEGAEQLARLLDKYGYSATLVPVHGALHLKTLVNYIGNETVLISGELINHPAFKKYRQVEVSPGELYAANCVLINDNLIIPEGFERVKHVLSALSYQLIEVPMSEFQKMDGGVTCLSLRF